MATSSSFISPDWVEPAHPATIHLYDDFVVIYKFIREKMQKELDEVFDKVSRDIGFVVTMTLPIKLEMSSGNVKSIECGADFLNGTIFDRQVIAIVKKSISQKWPTIKDGIYEFPIIWFDALKYKLRLDWVEPAHFRPIDILKFRQQYAISPDVQEPAHFLSRPDLLDQKTAQAVMALAEVYPELQLKIDMQARAQAVQHTMKPWLEPAHYHWQEPAHSLPGHGAVDYSRIRRPDWVEPAHFQSPREMNDIFVEIASVLKKYGY